MYFLVFNLIKMASIFLLSFGKNDNNLERQCFGVSQSPSCFPQNLKAELDGINFSTGSTLLKYLDDLPLCSPSQTSL